MLIKANKVLCFKLFLSIYLYSNGYPIKGPHTITWYAYKCVNMRFFNLNISDNVCFAL